MQTPSKVSDQGQGVPPKGNVNMLIETSGGNRSLKLVKAKDIARKIKSFEHFTYLWGEKARYYLPPKRCMTWHYISQILCNEKKLLKLDQVGHIIELPKMQGSLIKNMWNECKNRNGLHTYFPDIHEGQQVPRQYFFNVSLIRSSK